MIDVSNALRNPGQIYPLAEAFAISPVTAMGEELSFSDGDVHGEWMSVGTSISVRAVARVTVHAHCARCLSPVEARVEASLDEVFSPEADPDGDAHPFEGHTIDLSPVAQDAILLELPIRFLCREDCLGLCPVCGNNRNERKCTCLEEGGRSHSPFSALKSLMDDQNHEEV